MPTKPRRKRPPIGRPPKPLPQDIEVPNALAVWMAEAGVTAVDLAKVLGVTPGAVYRWRRGTRPPSRATASRITKITGGAVRADSWD